MMKAKLAKCASVPSLAIAATLAPLPLAAQQITGTTQRDEQPRTQRVDALLSRMSLAEKVDLIRGVEEPDATNQGQAGYLAGVPRLGVPALRLADGPPGLLTRHPSIAEVATMGLAATFDRDLAYRNGVLIADEARRLGIQVVLEPFINIDRDITFVRGYNTFGEDPVLTGAIGAAQIRGTQSRGVMAQAKHFVAYDSDGLDITVDDQTLHEVYVAPFAEAIDAGVSSIMCSYNKINGDWACGNPATLTTILRDQLGFKGFVTSDWGAVHSNRQLAGGMDMEMPGILGPDNPLAGVLPPYFDIAPKPYKLAAPRFDMMTKIFVGGVPQEPAPKVPNWEKAFPVNTGFANLGAALTDGTATTAMVDRAAGRVLYTMDRFGLLPGSPKIAVGPVKSQAELETINLRTAQKAAVLLKNESGALPLTAGDLRSLAMIGPGAGQLIAVGKAGERSLGFPERQISPYQAVRKAAGGDGVVLALADDMTATPITGWTGGGLARDGDADTSPLEAIDFTAANGRTLAANGTHRWSGTIAVREDGDYWFYLQLLGARGSLFVDGKRVSGSQSFKGALHGDTVQPNQDGLMPTRDGLNNVGVALALTAGEHRIAVEVEGDGSGSAEQVRLAWATPDTRRRLRHEAVEAARTAKKAVVFAWARVVPAFGLPGDQNQLIAEIAAVNPNTIVVLNVSQPVAMPWLDKVKAVVQMWWPGDQGGQATADILLGRENPGGRLPFTWGARLTDYPATDPGHPERSAAGIDGRTLFSEGVHIGYRWFEKQKIAPLFPFGHGLSYTRFRYADLRQTPAKDGGIDVSFRLTNDGAVAGDEVPQLYLSAPQGGAAGADFAVKALAGFDRVHLAPGRSQTVAIHLPRRRFEYWSSSARGWRLPAGARTLMVGASSRDIRLTAPVRPATMTKPN